MREVPGSNPGAPTSFPKVLPLPTPIDLQLLEPWAAFKDSELDRSRARGLAAELFTNWEEWVRQAMLPDDEDYAWANGTHSSHE